MARVNYTLSDIKDNMSANDAKRIARAFNEMTYQYVRLIHNDKGIYQDYSLTNNIAPPNKRTDVVSIDAVMEWLTL